jgi:hypothetical protein
MKTATKAALNALAVLLVLPPVLLSRLGALALGPAKAFAGWSQALSWLPGLTGAYLRRAFYRLVLPRCGADTWVGLGTVLAHPTAALGRPRQLGRRPVGGPGHCVIGAGSVVTKPIPSYAIAVGVPARVVSFRQGARAVGSEDGASAAVAQL